MSEVVELQADKVDLRKCPCCRYIVTQKEIEGHNFDMKCTRCKQYRHSEFIILK
jgi:hypothetical protein